MGKRHFLFHVRIHSSLCCKRRCKWGLVESYVKNTCDFFQINTKVYLRVHTFSLFCSTPLRQLGSRTWDYRDKKAERSSGLNFYLCIRLSPTRSCDLSATAILLWVFSIRSFLPDYKFFKGSPMSILSLWPKALPREIVKIKKW